MQQPTPKLEVGQVGQIGIGAAVGVFAPSGAQSGAPSSGSIEWSDGGAVIEWTAAGAEIEWS